MNTRLLKIFRQRHVRRGQDTRGANFNPAIEPPCQHFFGNNPAPKKKKKNTPTTLKQQTAHLLIRCRSFSQCATQTGYSLERSYCSHIAALFPSALAEPSLAALAAAWLARLQVLRVCLRWCRRGCEGAWGNAKKSTCATVAKSGCGCCDFKRGTAAANGRQHFGARWWLTGNDEMCDRRDQPKVLCPRDVCLIWLSLSMGN